MSKKKYEVIIKIYIVWRQEKNIATKLEQIEPSILAENLENFYVETRNASGDYHLRNTMKAVRSSLDRYLSSSRYRSPFSIIRNCHSVEKGKRSFGCTRLSNKSKLQLL